MNKNEINKQELARRCVQEGITPLFFTSGDNIYVHRSDHYEVEKALGLESVFRNFTEEEERSILLYPTTPDTEFEISSYRPREGDGRRAVERDFTFFPTSISFVDGQPMIEGTFLNNWYREKGDKVMFVPFDFSKEYTMELEKARRMSEQEKGLWAECLSTAGKPVYQFDIQDILNDVGERSGAYWPFGSLQTGDTISVTLPARLISDLKTSEPEFHPVKVHKDTLIKQGLFGNSWIVETDKAIFVSGDLEKELKAKMQERQDKAMLMDALAERYAPHHMDYSQHYFLRMMATTGLLITTQDDKNPVPIAFSDIKPGDKIAINYFEMADKSLSFDSDIDYRHLFGRKECGKDLATVDQVWTSGEDIVIESVKNGVHSVYSTLNFSINLAEKEAQLRYAGKSIEDHIIDNGLQRSAPTLLLSDITLLDPTTKEKIEPSAIKPGNKVIVSGTQIGDMRFDSWHCEMSISAEITVEKVFNKDNEIAIVAENGPILTDVDCRERFQNELECLMNQQNLEYAQSLDDHSITVEMDEDYSFPHQSRGYDD